MATVILPCVLFVWKESQQLPYFCCPIIHPVEYDQNYPQSNKASHRTQPQNHDRTHLTYFHVLFFSYHGSKLFLISTPSQPGAAIKIYDPPTAGCISPSASSPGRPSVYRLCSARAQASNTYCIHRACQLPDKLVLSTIPIIEPHAQSLILWAKFSERL